MTRGLEAHIAAWLEGWAIPDDVPAELTGGVVPADGPELAGRVTARTLHTLIVRRAPITLVLLAAAHAAPEAHPLSHPSAPPALLVTGGVSRVPAGEVAVDGELAAAIAELGRETVHPVSSIDALPGGDAGSMETVLPYLALLAPGLRIVPVLTPPGFRGDGFGARLGRLLKERSDVLAVAVGNLTRYGPAHSFVPAGVGPQAEEWFLEQDARLIARVQALDAEGLMLLSGVDRGNRDLPAVAAAVAAARPRDGWSGVLVEYTNSFRERGREPFEGAVGYAGLAF